MESELRKLQKEVRVLRRNIAPKIIPVAKMNADQLTHELNYHKTASTAIAARAKRAEMVKKVEVIKKEEPKPTPRVKKEIKEKPLEIKKNKKILSKKEIQEAQPSPKKTKPKIKKQLKQIEENSVTDSDGEDYEIYQKRH